MSASDGYRCMTSVCVLSSTGIHAGIHAGKCTDSYTGSYTGSYADSYAGSYTVTVELVRLTSLAMASTVRWQTSAHSLASAGVRHGAGA
jgi:hypothetical protein